MNAFADLVRNKFFSRKHLRCSCINRYFTGSEEPQDPQRILNRLINRYISKTTGDPYKLRLFGAQSVGNCQCVIDSRVHIQYHFHICSILPDF